MNQRLVALLPLPAHDDGIQRSTQMRNLTSFTLALVFSTSVFAAAPSEEEKINYLVGAIGSSDVTFIRNGSEHAAPQAQAHLQGKLKAAGDKVKTAEDFITLLASKSSQTGKPYLVKTKDEKTVELATWLRDKLKQMPSP